jgi:transcriptional regulator
MLDAIVSFEITLDRLEGKWKLNQNHPEERRQKVIGALRASNDPDSRQIAQEMEDWSKEL